jgi:hypothetical protein
MKERHGMLSRALALSVGLAAALVGSQGPEFAQQYRQRAGGALDELKAIVSRFEAQAKDEGLTAAAGVERLEADADPLARKRGEDMARTMTRASRLEAQLQAMASAGPVRRVFAMVAEVDPEVARRTLDAYEPAAPLTIEALATAGVAGVLGWGATHLIAWPLRRKPAANAPREPGLVRNGRLRR